VTGTLDLSALCLFLIVFYWTPPHFWALALLKQVDYTRARVPMAPLVWGERETMHQMVWYTIILIVLTFMPVLFGAFGLTYLISALILNGLLLFGVLRMLGAARAGQPWTGPAWWVYKYTLLYLALLFVAMAVDRAIG
jgi:protoheme IX farnesyltransferase